MNEELQRRREHLHKLMGGDQTATRIVNALFRDGITSVHEVLNTPSEELARVRNLGALAALRIGEMRGSLRPGGRQYVSMTGTLLNAVYESLSAMARNQDYGVVACGSHGQFNGEPPEIWATVKHFDRRYTLVLTPSEIEHEETRT